MKMPDIKKYNDHGTYAADMQVYTNHVKTEIRKLVELLTSHHELACMKSSLYKNTELYDNTTTILSKHNATDE